MWYKVGLLGEPKNQRIFIMLNMIIYAAVVMVTMNIAFLVTLINAQQFDILTVLHRMIGMRSDDLRKDWMFGWSFRLLLILTGIIVCTELLLYMTDTKMFAELPYFPVLTGLWVLFVNISNIVRLREHYKIRYD